MERKSQLNVRISQRTAENIRTLQAAWGTSQTETITILVEQAIATVSAKESINDKRHDTSTP